MFHVLYNFNFEEMKCLPTTNKPYNRTIKFPELPQKVSDTTFSQQPINE